MFTGRNGMRAKKYVNLSVVLCAIGLISTIGAGCASIVQEREYEAPGGFLLGPEDVLEIAVWKNSDLSRTTAIRPDGLISLPIIGDVQASGLTADGLAVFQVYNRISWLNALSKLMKVGLEHEDAPVILKFSIGEFKQLLAGFNQVQVIGERFPVKSRRVQRPVRRDLQLAPTIVGPTLRLASARVLS